MVWCLWGSKGGSGCSTTAAAVALLCARRGPVLLVDLAGGDQARILGVEPRGPGLVRWLRHANPPPDSLARLELPVVDRLSLLPFRGSARYQEDSGDPPGDAMDLEERVNLLAHLLAADDRLVVVDLGLPGPVDSAVVGRSGSAVVSPFPAIIGVAERSTLVTRLCYLALACAMEQLVPDDVIVVSEPDRALRVDDVKAALRVPVATVRWDPAVARAVDSGLLTRRLPRALHRIPLAASTSRPVDSAAAATAETGGERR